MVVTYLLYELALTGVGHSAANLPFDRSPTPPAKSNNPTPFTSTQDQRAMTISMNAEINGNTIGEPSP
jgi:hypothetical protein